MNNLITLDNVCLAYGLEPLLDHVKFQVAAGERVCLIGRNGTGKSSLLKIIEGSLIPDSGTVYHHPHLRLARLAQELPQNTDTTVYEFVAGGLEEIGRLLAAYHEVTHRLAHQYEESDLVHLEKLQQMIDAKNAWAFEQKIESILARLQLDPNRPVAELSGGWQRRAALAKALVVSPELLLLDEPTNHLDIEAIQWLEEQLLASQVGLIFITHDRSLLQRLATRIIELDRGQLTSWPGDYANFLRRKEEMLQAEAKLNADFDKKLAEEERWIRQGIKARRTRNEGRVRALEALRLERSKRREVQAKVNLKISDTDKSGHLVLEAQGLNHSFNDKPLIRNFSVRVMRGDRIGLIGPNGVGKSTLLNILLGNLAPQQGKVTQGTKLQIAYFDQLRKALDLEKTVAENVVQGSDFIEIKGRRQHIVSYLADFLFTPARARTPVKALSGGECNRLLLARLFSLPANLLIMDEPTNDLDIETLELLEELLSNYQGTLLLVSHDRSFLDNVVTSTLVFEGEGCIQEFVGGYQNWLEQAKPKIVASEAKTPKARTSVEKAKTAKIAKKLSYKEQKELAELPKRIETLEGKQKDLESQIASGTFYEQEAAFITQTLAALSQVTLELEQAYDRWNKLESGTTD